MTEICPRCRTKINQGNCPSCPVPPPPPPPIPGAVKASSPPALPGGPPPIGKTMAPPSPSVRGGDPAGASSPAPSPAPQLAKANMFSRLVGFILDGILTVGPVVALWQMGLVDDGPWGYVAGGWAVLYWLFRDSFGASLGKVLTGIQVVLTKGGKSGLGRSLLRNLTPLLLIIIIRHPLLLTLALLAEPALVIFSGRGRRLGDLLAGTQVIKKRPGV